MKNEPSSFIDRPYFLPVIYTVMFLWIVGSMLMLPEMDYDEGMWNYMADMWLNHGRPPYLATLENKPPGIYLIYYFIQAVVGTTFWIPRMIGAVVLVFTAMMVYALARRLAGDRPARLVVLVFAATMGWRLMDGPLPGHTETFMIFFTTAAFLVFFGAPVSSRRVLIVGMLLGGALAFKQIAMVTTLAMVVILWLRCTSEKAPLGARVRWIAVLAVGIAATTVLMTLPLLLSGVSIAEIWRQAWLVLLEGPGNSPSSLGIRIFRASRTWLSPEMTLFYPLILWYVVSFRRFGNPALGLWILIWFILDFAGVNAAGYYFGHQLRQMMPSLCIMIAMLIRHADDASPLFASATKRYSTLFLLALLLWVPPGSIFQLLEKRWSFKGDYRIESAKWIIDNTAPDDFVYIYDRDANVIHAYAGRQCPTRYFDLSFVRRNGAIEEIERDLTANPPSVILVQATATQPKWLVRILERYRLIGSVGAHQIYRQGASQ